MATWMYSNTTGTIAFVVVEGRTLASRRAGEMLPFEAEGHQHMGVYRMQGHDTNAEPILEELPVESGRVEELSILLTPSPEQD